MTPLRRLWSRHPVLLTAFVLAAALSVFFTGRIVVKSVYWATHREAGIAPWMTVGYIGRSWDLDPREIDARAGLPMPERGRPLTLEEIARERGVPVEDIVSLVRATVADLKAEQVDE
ncbi:hypothetical protein E7811_00425 [Aliigemmobacter aestuarii]|uniref:Uncharacterized protein n=1 Tax=Aliigemmobacter aestuarii TaxID=1445661 RepID=A0A4S3MPE8_9RHOB|nr:hypothetical protein [Gemmobacter aestuarii]THD84259.1 hypothetical protein E7811_00425 [Gemmobacter aestuarii]